MRDCVREAFGIEPLVLPFWREVLPERAALDRERGQSSRFLYVASPYPHKNHDRLFEAWRLLAAEGLRPELHVTLPTGCPAERTAARLREAGVRIVNHGEVDKKKLEDLYSSCHALVFPSVLESFGLPLLEARAAGLAIIAAERDYVRDTLDPDETFDPESALSIARAVKRYLRFVERRPEVVSAAEFARRILAGDL
jgi:glycosyltransferase involved in cell wall biosynthesis